ncbi:MAG: hypothetical protein Q4A74_09825 [Cardiobacteriaceae bacterium]|nr:hypothetical protein [Cardiobacteriaceae bacterium]
MVANTSLKEPFLQQYDARLRENQIKIEALEKELAIAQADIIHLQ